MPALGTVILSVVGSFIGAFFVAYTNNRFNRDRDELNVLRNKGEQIISGLKTISETYIDAHNHVSVVKREDGRIDYKSQLYSTTRPLENEICALVEIYFPSCKLTLDEWQGKMAYADGILRSLAGGSDGKEYDPHVKDYVDKSHTYVLDLSSCAAQLTRNIASEIAVARAISPYAEIRRKGAVLFETFRNRVRFWGGP